MTGDIDLTCFSEDYRHARRAFRAACGERGITPRSYENPERGPHDEALVTDTAWIGPADAAGVVVVISATHGVEGFPGAALQTDWLRRNDAAAVPADTAMLLIHALNPFGFAWLRRVTEDGVDLNRNYVDFARPLPGNPGYRELADALIPADLEPPTLAAADARLEAYRDAHGQRDFEIAISGGQYEDPAGLFYGGQAPTWSRRTSEAIIADYRLAQRQLVAIVDVHTGLGPFGYGELISDHRPDSTGGQRARRWYGPSVTEPAIGTSTSVPKTGLSDYGWQAALGDAATFIALEFGTFPPAEMFRVLRADHWLHRGGPPDWQDNATRIIKDALRRHFYPATADWQEMILHRGRQVLRQALAGLVSDLGSSRSV